MNMNYYPDFDPSWLLPVRLAFESMTADPLWLEREDCPYDGATIEALRGLWAKFRAKPEAVETARSNLASASDKWTQLSDEMFSLFDELKNFSARDIAEDDVKEKMAYFRTATALLEKITGLAERAHNVKTVSDFRSRILQVFDEILTPEQRTSAMEKLTQ